MIKKPLTIECIKKFNPSHNNQMEVESHNSSPSDKMKIIRIIGMTDEDVFYYDRDGLLDWMGKHFLSNYISPYQPVRKYKALWYFKKNPELRVSTRYYENEEVFYNSMPMNRVLVQLIKDDFTDD